MYMCCFIRLLFFVWGFYLRVSSFWVNCFIRACFVYSAEILATNQLFVCVYLLWAEIPFLYFPWSRFHCMCIFMHLLDIYMCYVKEYVDDTS